MHIQSRQVPRILLWAGQLMIVRESGSFNLTQLYQLDGFRKSNSLQNRQLIVYYHLSVTVNFCGGVDFLKFGDFLKPLN